MGCGTGDLTQDIAELAGQVVEFGGGDNIRHIVMGINNALDRFGYSQNKAHNPWYFPSVSEYCSVLERQGFVVRDLAYFDRPTELEDGEAGLKNWITMFGKLFFEGVPPEIYEEMMLFIEDQMNPVLFRNGTWFADYKRLRIRAEKSR